MNPFGCYKSTIRLRSGLYFDLKDPQPDQFTLEDIAGALSKICRFGGQIEDFYSVAEHCVHCAEQAYRDGRSHEVHVACLLHDAAEAFLGDVVKPLKVMLADYGPIEDSVEAVIAAKFRIEPSTRDAVKEIDRAMLIAERKRLFTPDSVVWTGEQEVRQLSPRIGPWNSSIAEARFMAAARTLGLAGFPNRLKKQTVPEHAPVLGGEG